MTRVHAVQVVVWCKGLALHQVEGHVVLVVMRVMVLVVEVVVILQLGGGHGEVILSAEVAHVAGDGRVGHVGRWVSSEGVHAGVEMVHVHVGVEVWPGVLHHGVRVGAHDIVVHVAHGTATEERDSG